MYKIIPFIFFLFLLFSSCQNDLEKALQGWWSVDYLQIHKVEYIYCLSLNAFTFKKEIVSIPQNLCDTIRSIEWQDKSCSYTVEKMDIETYIMKFHTDNELLNDTFRMVFFKDAKEKLLKLYLVSKDKEMVLSKGLFNFDRNISTINNLIKETGSGNIK